MIKPAIATLTAFRNGDFSVAITLADSNGPIDLTGFVARMQVREREGATGNPLVAVTESSTIAGSVISYIDRAGGKLEVLIKKADWSAIPAVESNLARNFAWDLLLKDATDFECPYLRGPFAFNEGVTQ